MEATEVFQSNEEELKLELDKEKEGDFVQSSPTPPSTSVPEPQPEPNLSPPDTSVEETTLDTQFQNLGLEEKSSDTHSQTEENSDTQDPQKEEDPGEGEIVPKEGKTRKYQQQYPLRSGEPDCSFYLRTRACRYGSNCRFNHPSRRKNQARSSGGAVTLDPAQAVTATENDDHPEKTGQIECKYNRTGSCKFGSSCRYYHPRDKTVVAAPVDFNFLGLPIRPGEKECPHYMRTGSCKFSTNCRFHHPDPTAAVESDTPSGHDNGGSVPLHSSDASQPASWALPTTSPSYPPMMYCSPQVVQPKTEWNGYQASSSVGPLYSADGNVYRPPAPVMNSSNLHSTQNHYPIPIDAFPERPGQPECQFFMKNGDCKYRSACRFHHPKNRASHSLATGSMGLPSGPGPTNCANYIQYGVCNNGPSCKFNHPPPFNVNNYVNARGAGMT
ncbi:hypothetical protein GIB67_018854 [Kingdonia uniflora]|uniref:C3H1-type domain-containing protein n=1 Tax=Kingdonia uniflora TaxID=39325 RepID=A0A7J7NEI6_9MAGN|nr:hypothetical protein GIB67_018854 [Kingdonia uniflora]